MEDKYSRMKKYRGIIGVLVIALWLVGCGRPSATPSPTVDTTIPTVESNNADTISIKGTVVPARSVTLSAISGGTVAAVPVSEGERVSSGTVLVRLDTTDVDLSVQQAQAALAAAQAQLALTEAGVRPEQIAVLQAQADAAAAGVAQAAAQRDEQNAGGSAADVLDAQAAMMQAELDHKQANETHDDMMKCYTVNLPDGSSRNVCPTLGTYEEITRAQMEAAYAAMQAARAQYDAAQALPPLESSTAQAAVQSAAGQSDAVQAQLDQADAGSSAESLALAQSNVAGAQAGVAQAQGALDYTVFKAPFDGTVTDVTVKPGDTAAAGDLLVTVATLDHLQIKTTDLTELDVVNMAVGQNVMVVMDAMPDQPIQGVVSRIDPQGNDYLGDVIFTALIDVDAPTWLRWGMTAEIGIDQGAGNGDITAALQAEAPANNAPASTPIIADGTMEPEHWSALSLLAGGRVAGVARTTGDVVKKGDVLVKLDSTAAELNVQAAAAAVATAKARLAVIQADPQPAYIDGAQAKVRAAQGDLQQAIDLRDQLQSGADNQTAGLQAQLEEAKSAYQQAVISAGNTDDQDVLKQISLLNIRTQAAQDRLSASQESLAAQLRGVNAGILAAQARVTAAKAELALLTAPPTDGEVAAAQAEVARAEAALAAAQVALDRTQLRAPFDGTVTQMNVEAGQSVAPGQPLVVIAALDRLQVVTLNLTELDVAKLSVGQSVRVTADALPDQVIDGQIVQIKGQSIDYQGDVTYPVTVALQQVPPALRWGMRVMVEIPQA